MVRESDRTVGGAVGPRAPALRDELLQLAGSGAPGTRNDRLWEVLDDFECWPGWRLVGTDGADAAWRIAQWAIEDVGLQRRCLEMLEVAVACNDADPVHLAYLSDRVRMNDGRDQLHGSQFVLSDSGDLQPWPVDDVAAVDARRARLGLPPLSVHAAAMAAEWRTRGGQRGGAGRATGQS
jgi:hypothetical protein